MLNPFEEDQTISSHKWYGHSVTCEGGTSAENKVIHGICAKCFPTLPGTSQVLQCFECRVPFPDRRISEIDVARDGSLIREALLPAINIENEAVRAVRLRRVLLQNFEDSLLTSPCLYFAIAGVSSIAYLGALVIASSSSTTYLVPVAHLAVRETHFTPTTLAAACAAPFLQALATTSVVLGVIGCIGEAVKACSTCRGRQRH